MLPSCPDHCSAISVSLTHLDVAFFYRVPVHVPFKQYCKRVYFYLGPVETGLPGAGGSAGEGLCASHRSSGSV